jgi:hypothetical protein
MCLEARPGIDVCDRYTEDTESNATNQARPLSVYASTSSHSVHTNIAGEKHVKTVDSDRRFEYAYIGQL